MIYGNIICRILVGLCNFVSLGSCFEYLGINLFSVSTFNVFLFSCRGKWGTKTSVNHMVGHDHI